MGMQLRILGSSSQGNCALLTWSGGKVLIEAGFSGRRIGALLEQAGERIDEIDAIFLTHEHSDHSKGLYGLSRYKKLMVFSNERTARGLDSSIPRPIDWRIFGTGEAFRFRGLTVSTFGVPHDAFDPVGYSFECGQPQDLFDPPTRCVWMTDLGFVPDGARPHLEGADLLVLEANHDDGLLERDERRPWAVKQRIRGRHGHLSNRDARELLRSVAQPRWKRVFLAHLSRDCNNVGLVRDYFNEPFGDGHPARPLPLTIVDPVGESATPAFSV